jgi:hypothetical protein
MNPLNTGLMLSSGTNSPPAPIQCRPHVSGIAYIGYAHSHKIGNHHDLKVFGSAKTNDP